MPLGDTTAPADLIQVAAYSRFTLVCCHFYNFKQIPHSGVTMKE